MEAFMGHWQASHLSQLQGTDLCQTGETDHSTLLLCLSYLTIVLELMKKYQYQHLITSIYIKTPFVPYHSSWKVGVGGEQTRVLESSGVCARSWLATGWDRVEMEGSVMCQACFILSPPPPWDSTHKMTAEVRTRPAGKLFKSSIAEVVTTGESSVSKTCCRLLML